MPKDSNESKQPRLDESLVCDVCGRFGAVEFGDRRLCPDCYESFGSCCPEFAGRNATRLKVLPVWVEQS